MSSRDIFVSLFLFRRVSGPLNLTWEIKLTTNPGVNAQSRGYPLRLFSFSRKELRSADCLAIVSPQRKLRHPNAPLVGSESASETPNSRIVSPEGRFWVMRMVGLPKGVQPYRLARCRPNRLQKQKRLAGYHSRRRDAGRKPRDRHLSRRCRADSSPASRRRGPIGHTAAAPPVSATRANVGSVGGSSGDGGQSVPDYGQATHRCPRHDAGADWPHRRDYRRERDTSERGRTWARTVAMVAITCRIAARRNHYLA